MRVKKGSILVLSNESAVVDNDDRIFLPFIEALVVDNWLRRV